MGFFIFLLLLGFPALEIYVLIQVGERIGFVNTVFALLATGVLGVGLAKNEGRALHAKLTQAMARGEVPTQQMLQSALVFLGGVLLVIPGFVSDVIGLILILPGTRHLLAYLVKRKIQNQMRAGFSQFRVFTSGPFGAGAGFRTGGFGRNPFEPQAPERSEDDSFGRDVTPKVIDVTPISKSKVEDEPSGKGH
jgi:UPF0716 protein FxsA